MVAISDWNGLLAGARSPEAEIRLEMALKQSDRGGSGAFLGKASDGNQYWIKPLNNIQGRRVPITEQIIARVGRLIDAPVCEVKTIEIPDELAGWEFRKGEKLERGIAHASLSVPTASETNQLGFRDRDENSKNHAKILALYDWCWGADPQWLMSMSDDYRFYSHDHGWFLPPAGPNWTEDDLISNVNTPNVFNDSNNGLDMDAVKDVCESLETVRRDNIKISLQAVPTSWPVTDSELEAVGFFLEHRGPEVAKRLRDSLGG